nr:glycosyltransferase [Methylosinus sp. KRF6]
MHGERTVYVDARCLQQADYRNRGIGRHFRGLLKAIPSDLRSATKLVALVDPAEPILSLSDVAIFDEVTDRFVPVDNAILFNGAPLNNGERWRVPPGSHVIRVGIVHDFIAHDFPGLIRSDSLARSLLRNTLELRSYDLLLPNSQTSENRQKALVSSSIASIVTGIVVKDDFFASERREVSQYEFPDRFFLVAAGDNPRKNVETAIKAFGRGASTFGGAHLIIVGGYDWAAQARVRSSVGPIEAVDWSRVHFLPHVSDDTLAEGYRRAVATIVPSFIEGFSMPIVEAIASGGIVIASSCEAHRELVEFPLFDPKSADELAELMTSSANDAAWRAKATALQKGAADRFRSEAIGDRVWPQILSFRRSAPSSADVGPRTEVSARRRGDRPNILFVTPYPPEATGVGQLHAEGMPAFLERADVTVATLKAPRRAMGVRHPRVIRPDDIIFSDYDRIFYVIGNALYHTFVHDMLLERGGEVILHDSRLFEYYLNVRGIERTAKMAGAALGRQVGQEEVSAWEKDRRKLPTPMLDEVVEASSRLFVFTPTQQQAIRQFYGKEAILQPIPLHIGFEEALFTPRRMAAARNNVGFNSNALDICSFGSVDASKGCYEILLLLNQLRAYGCKAKLHFVGACDPNLEARMKELFIGPLGMTDLVSFHGAVKQDVYTDFLLAADLGIQFRRVGFGQPSGALTECIATGVWTIANDALVDAHRAPHYVRRVSDRLSPLSIALTILELMDEVDISVRDHEARVKAQEGRSWRDYVASVLDV